MKIKALILAAGHGSRLKELSKLWPKCLMPINGRPLLEIWLDNLLVLGIKDIVVNTHYFSNEVSSFLSRDKYKELISESFESKLLGSAGTVRNNYSFLSNSTILLVHGDNLCDADLTQFYQAHLERPEGCLMTMMTFTTDNPQSCGIVEYNNEGVLVDFHEKVDCPPGNEANGAVYLFEQEVLDFIYRDEEIVDFSNQVIPAFINKIFVWHNKKIHIDIGTPDTLLLAQNVDPFFISENKEGDDWESFFQSHIIHEEINKMTLKDL